MDLSLLYYTDCLLSVVLSVATEKTPGWCALNEFGATPWSSVLQIEGETDSLGHSQFEVGVAWALCIDILHVCFSIR